MPRNSLSLSSRLTNATAVAPSVGTKPSPRTERLLRQRLTLARQLTALNKATKILDAKLLPLAKAEALPDAKGARRLVVEGAGKLTLTKGESSHLDIKTLLALGVRPRVIAKATKKTPYEYVRVYPEGEGEE